MTRRCNWRRLLSCAAAASFGGTGAPACAFTAPAQRANLRIVHRSRDCCRHGTLRGCSLERAQVPSMGANKRSVSAVARTLRSVRSRARRLRPSSPPLLKIGKWEEENSISAGNYAPWTHIVRGQERVRQPAEMPRPAFVRRVLNCLRRIRTLPEGAVDETSFLLTATLVGTLTGTAGTALMSPYRPWRHESKPMLVRMWRISCSGARAVATRNAHG